MKHLEPAAGERIIVALDYPDIKQAQALVCRLDGLIRFYKIGLEIFMSGQAHVLLHWLCERSCKVFVDLKFFDVPNTVAAAVARLADSGAEFITVHGNDAMLDAAVKNKGAHIKVLAVTMLTSLDQGDLDDLGFQCSPEALVLSRARRAAELGCDGIVASGQELNTLRQVLQRRLLIVVPGIRPLLNRCDDDQKRITSPEQAMREGADYIVVGRSITRAPDPLKAAQDMQRAVRLGLGRLDQNH